MRTVFVAGAGTDIGKTYVSCAVIRALRGFTARTADEEPKWRKKGDELLTGYQKSW